MMVPLELKFFGKTSAHPAGSSRKNLRQLQVFLKGGGRLWPIPEMTAAGRRVGLPGWICRSCDLLGMAALDPMQNSRLLFSRDGSQFAANYPDGLKVFDVVRSH
jgi:hypothetical protein